MDRGRATDVVADACTFWPEGSWAHCCRVHDLAYADLADKITSDLELALCVAQTGNGGMALLMLAGVSVFGWLCYRRRRK